MLSAFLMPAASALHVRIPPMQFSAMAAAEFRSRAGAASTMSLVDDIKSTVADNKVVMYSKSYCPFCNQCKGLFVDKGIFDGAEIIELDLVDGGDKIQEALLEFTGQRTVPNVFIGGTHVGGNDDTQKAAKSGKLDELLAK